MEEHVCAKERDWGEVRTALQFFQEAEVRRENREIRAEERENRMIVAVESVAAQGEAIKSLQETGNRHDKALGEVFTRIRKVENPSIIVKLMRTKVGRIALATLGFMSLIGFVKNPESLGKFIKAVIQ